MTLVLFVKNVQIKKSPRGNDLMNKISDQISVGAKAFLTTEYKYLTGFVLVTALVLFLMYFFNPPSGHWADGLRYSLCFLTGGFLSASAGWRGMATATVGFEGNCNIVAVVALFRLLTRHPILGVIFGAIFCFR